MRYAGSLILPLAVALLAGCALAPRRPAPWSLPKVGDAPISGRWVQTLVLERQGRALELLAVIERDGGLLTVVGLSPMGQRLVRISWSDGRVEQESDANLPVKIDGEAILRDIVFANWPADKLTEALGRSGWTGSFDGARRTLAWKGRPWLEIRPDSGDVLIVDHVAEKYRVRVTTVERSAP